MQLQAIPIKKDAPALVFFLTIKISNNSFLCFEKEHCYKKRGSDTYQKPNYTTSYMKLSQDFCILTVGYTKSYHLKKLIRAVNNTPPPEL